MSCLAVVFKSGMLNFRDSQRAEHKRQKTELNDVLVELRSLRDANLLLATRIEELQRELLLAYDLNAEIMSIGSHSWRSTWITPPLPATQDSNPEFSQFVPFQTFGQNGGLWDPQLL